MSASNLFLIPPRHQDPLRRRPLPIFPETQLTTSSGGGRFLQTICHHKIVKALIDLDKYREIQTLLPDKGKPGEPSWVSSWFSPPPPSSRTPSSSPTRQSTANPMKCILKNNNESHRFQLVSEVELGCLGGQKNWNL